MTVAWQIVAWDQMTLFAVNCTPGSPPHAFLSQTICHQSSIVGSSAPATEVLFDQSAGSSQRCDRLPKREHPRPDTGLPPRNLMQFVKT